MLKVLEPVLHWTHAKRKDIIWHLDRGLVTPEEICQAHGISLRRIEQWRHLVVRHRYALRPFTLPRIFRFMSLTRVQKAYLAILSQHEGEDVHPLHLMEEVYGNKRPGQQHASETIKNLIPRIRHLAEIERIYGEGFRLRFKR